MSETNDPLDTFELKKPSELIAGLDLNLVIEFFAVLSRFEYALKDCNYMRERDEHATVAWERFAGDMAGNLSTIDSVRINKAIEFLNACPPKTQMKNHDWVVENLRVDNDDSKAILYVTKVRNNLFHGGKYKNADVGRDMLLISSSLDILYGCLLVRPDVKRSYEYIG